MTQSQSIEIKILGQKTVLKVRDLDPKLVEQVVALADSKIKAVEKRMKGAASSQQVTLLALFDLCQQYLAARKSTLEWKSEVDDKAAKLLTLVESELKNSS